MGKKYPSYGIGMPDLNISFGEALRENTMPIKASQIIMNSTLDSEGKAKANGHLVFGVFGTENYCSVEELLKEVKVSIEQLSISLGDFKEKLEVRMSVIEGREKEDNVKVLEKYTWQ